MATPQQLPMQGKQIETRPIYVEEWLDSLPYIDFNQTIDLLHKALKASNKIPMKSSQRMELVSLYHRPYYYYLDTQIRTGAQHTIQSIDVMQAQVTGMRAVAVELARASRLAMDEALTHKSLWGQNKHPLQAILMSIKYLSHALIYTYLEYAPTPQKVWQELNFIYQYALSIEQQNTPVKPVGAASKNETSDIEHAYKRIALVSLADPYHLPFGAIWEIYHQLAEWTDLTVTGPWQAVKDPQGIFVLSLDKDTGPLACSKFSQENANRMTRMLVTEKLLVALGNNIEKIEKNPGGNNNLKFSPHYAEYLLRIVHKAWGMPQKRVFPRKTKTGRLNIAHGLNAIYYFLNNKQDFLTAEPKEDAGEEAVITDVDVGFNPMAVAPANFSKESWHLVDTSSGGFAVTREGKPGRTPRVGDLVGMAMDEEHYPAETFRVGVLRWLLVRQGKLYKAGIQLDNQQVSVAGIRATNGNADKGAQRAIIEGNPLKEKDITVLTARGLYQPDGELEMTYKGKTYPCNTGKRIEATTCFEKFQITLAD